MAKTATELLSQVEDAIDKIARLGQSFTIEGTQYNRVNLDALRRMRNTLKAEIAREPSGGVRGRYGTPPA